VKFLFGGDGKAGVGTGDESHLRGSSFVVGDEGERGGLQFENLLLCALYLNETCLTLLVGFSELCEIGFREIEKFAGGIAGEFPGIGAVVKGFFALASDLKAGRIDALRGGFGIDLSLLNAFLIPVPEREGNGNTETGESVAVEATRIIDRFLLLDEEPHRNILPPFCLLKRDRSGGFVDFRESEDIIRTALQDCVQRDVDAGCLAWNAEAGVHSERGFRVESDDVEEIEKVMPLRGFERLCLLLKGAAAERCLHHIEGGDESLFGLLPQKFHDLPVQLHEIPAHGDMFSRRDQIDEGKIDTTSQLTALLRNFRFGENDLVSSQAFLVLELGGDGKFLREANFADAFVVVIAKAICDSRDIELRILKTPRPFQASRGALDFQGGNGELPIVPVGEADRVVARQRFRAEDRAGRRENEHEMEPGNDTGEVHV